MLILHGSYRRARVVATKWEECPRCGVIGVHAIVRRSTWAHIYFVPFLLIWVSHWMICANCGLPTKLSWRQVLPAVRARKLVIDRPRPRFEYERQQHVDAFGRMPDAHEVFDTLTVTPERRLLDMAIVAFLVGYAALLALLVFKLLVH